MIEAAGQREIGSGTHPPLPGVLDELSGALSSARASLAGFLELMSLEARRAGRALAWMAACAILAAICLVSAWLGLLAALAMVAIALGLPPILAVLTVAAVNLVAGAVLIRVCIGRSQDLLFAATRRQVAGTPAGPSPRP